MKRISNAFRKLHAVFVLSAAMAVVLPAQTFTTLHSFDITDGVGPQAALVQATNGNLYGTTSSGGLNNLGTVFKITSTGTLRTLHSFGGTDGVGPKAALVQATNGNLYGTTSSGGLNNLGTVFKITSTGTFTTLYNFCSQSGCTDGGDPSGALVQGTDGNFYGTTYQGGLNNSGTVFKITPSGKLTTLYTFCVQGGCPDGQNPYAGLVQATDGDLYGTTANGGAFGGGSGGTVFKITPSGTLTTLFTFCNACLSGNSPHAALIQATDVHLYGTTFNGGAGNGGTAFKMTPSGTLTLQYRFCTQSGCVDGSNPWGLAQATDGNLYGTTLNGGVYGYGTVFKLSPTGGTLTTLYTFCVQRGCPDGQNPYAGLVQGTNGNLYGTTVNGGANTNASYCPSGCGTVFSLSVGIGPFVETQPTSGKVGAAVKILGTNLTDATSVSFNGAAAVFKVVSRSLITTMVPGAANTGKVQVVTPSGTLSSNVPFRVRP